MTIRTRLTLRFTGLVSGFLALTFACLYGFSWYFISSDFYRRLDRKASTYGELVIRHQLDPNLLRRYSRLRKDHLPAQKITIYNQRNESIFSTSPARGPHIPVRELDVIRRQQQRHFRWRQDYVFGIVYKTGPESYVVVASAQNLYGDAFLRTLIWGFVGLFGLIVCIVALSGWLYAGDALEPMQRLEQQLSRIFPNNQQERLPIGRETDEISRLSATINRLLDRVEESFDLQKMFVANVSHELKNPLTQINSQLEVSLLQRRDGESYQQTIRSVLEDVRALSALTRELLQLSQVSRADAVTLLSNSVRIDEIVWDVLDAVGVSYPHCTVVVDVGELPDDFEQLTVPGNPALLKTALKNLIENACKFSDDGQAHVRVRSGGDAVQVSVKNKGVPIPEADLPYIFEPFFRSHQTAERPGHGVGLSLVERIIRLHGGRLTVTSGDGFTVFDVELYHQPLL